MEKHNMGAENCIKNGTPWYDTDGKRIHVQFPHILYVEGKYYLYGSNKEFSDGKSGIWHWGIRMYESDDFYNWKDLGLIIPPTETDKDSPLYPYTKMDAPCIIYNEKTRKWVCWLIDMPAKQAYVYTSDTLQGPYTNVRKNLLPCGFTMGDYDLAKNDEGQAFIYFNNPHTKIICAELTEDYTDVKGNYSVLLEHPESVPFNRESPAYFTRNGKHYLITSGTTGFFPNPSEVAVADDYFGPFDVIGDPHVKDNTQTSFHSQIRSVFKVPQKKDLYIALADRWLPQYMHVPYETYKECFKIWSHNSSEEERERADKLFAGINYVEDITQAEYVVLPIIFDGNKVRIDWRESWRLEEFD